MYKIKEINFEAIIVLSKSIRYNDATENIKLLKGKYEIPKTWKGMFKKIKMLING